jgi:hypothetical protein
MQEFARFSLAYIAQPVADWLQGEEAEARAAGFRSLDEVPFSSMNGERVLCDQCATAIPNLHFRWGQLHASMISDCKHSTALATISSLPLLLFLSRPLPASQHIFTSHLTRFSLLVSPPPPPRGTHTLSRCPDTSCGWDICVSCAASSRANGPLRSARLMAGAGRPSPLICPNRCECVGRSYPY